MRISFSHIPSRRRRRGSVYIAVVGAAVLVALLGASAAMVTRVQLRQGRLQADAVKARLYARGGAELAVQWINSDREGWRDRPSGVWASGRAISDGTFSVSVTDPDDGDLDDSDRDWVVVEATGRKGPARHVTQLKLRPEFEPLSCLETAFHVESYMDIEWKVWLESDQTISSNGRIVANGAEVWADAEAGSYISGWDFHRDENEYVPDREMPELGELSTYIEQGTEIPWSSLPASTDPADEGDEDTGKRYINRALLGPNHNPFGTATNPKGIYWINCGGNGVVIRKSRILGTLILVNPHSYNSRFSNSNLVAPFVENYPSVLVYGDMIFAGSGDPLREKDNDEEVDRVNYNPVGAPYEGQTDSSDNDDAYPSVVCGLVYVTGTARLYRDTNTFDGVFLCGGVSFQTETRLRFDYDPIHRDDPPPGFHHPARMVVVPGSGKQVVNEGTGG